MSWTILQLCEEAYAELALSGYTFDLTPDEMQRAGRRLSAMMASWDANGIAAGFTLATSPDTIDLDADSGLPQYALEPVFLNLAVRLAPGEGKALSQDTRARAKEGYDLLMSIAAAPQTQQLRQGLPLGAGNKTRNHRFVTPPDTDDIQLGEGGDLDFLG